VGVEYVGSATSHADVRRRGIAARKGRVTIEKAEALWNGDADSVLFHHALMIKGSKRFTGNDSITNRARGNVKGLN
jgi:hypothetical protein